MIRYALKCRDGHVFDSWFQSASAFDALAKAGHLNCVQCGGTDVEKTLMAPRVASESAPKDTAQAQDVADMRRAVEENATYVGSDFAAKAREMHAGEAPKASIYGEADAREARALVEEGIPVLPLPFKPKQKLQ